ncbi:MAG: ATP-dependent Clp protease adaptor ClpS [Deferribacteres bacterium]|nr:ATP-dependent Clp protease adaptor ClpS [candidate division KSB1 bacterium]MCB9512256.1 ATP-dependent Clp protease adaptor ClpS [Deferribacteres bacterium]
MFRLSVHPDQDEETIVDDTTDERLKAPWKVILYNDDIHSFDEVILQLMKATGCTDEEAARIAFEAHSKGKAVAFTGSFEKCFKVMGILRQIQLIVEIEG